MASAETAYLEHPTRTPMSVGVGLIKAFRPRQWVKNVLVAAAPFAGGALLNWHVVGLVGLAFVAFSLAASAIYLINDTRDLEADRAHPIKRSRPIAAGVVPPTLAVGVAALSAVLALIISTLADANLTIVIALYLVTQCAYCLWLKHEPVIDLCVVASGFLMRAIAGGAATAIALSPWFLLVAAFGSLFMAAGKRYSETLLAMRTGAKIRKSLEGYSASYLRFVWGLSASVMITTYGLWAFEFRTAHHHSMWPVISIGPLVVATLRYAAEIDRGNGGEPEEIALGDRVLQVLAATWIVTLAFAVHA